MHFYKKKCQHILCKCVEQKRLSDAAPQKVINWCMNINVKANWLQVAPRYIEHCSIFFYRHHFHNDLLTTCNVRFSWYTLFHIFFSSPWFIRFMAFLFNSFKLNLWLQKHDWHIFDQNLRIKENLLSTATILQTAKMIDFQVKKKILGVGYSSFLFFWCVSFLNSFCWNCSRHQSLKPVR